MKASHMALLSAQAVKLRREGRFTGMGDYYAARVTRRMLTVIAQRVQLEACTVAELDLLLSSWANLAGVSRGSKWYPPPAVLHAVVCRLLPDPKQVPLDMHATTATRLNNAIPPPQTTPLATPLQPPLSSHPPSATDCKATSPQSPRSAVPPLSSPSPTPISKPAPASQSPIFPATVYTSTSSSSGGSGSVAYTALSGPQANPPQEGLRLHGHVCTELQSSAQPMVPFEHVGMQLATRAGGSFGNKLKAASCSSLASISMSLHKLHYLDNSMLQLMAQFTTKKAKHGGVRDLAMLAYVLQKNNWMDHMVCGVC
ncbi:hypothetical protein DUNSADRAFT_5024 [Dunaliella salina]|uniref:Uncharacterized protein n=1 Tax=Dunaliella salina TaxID=3046 RepID=A0ABQ7HAA7_DUNSA|nr:hypothetical protein DUNSADRAFT_5024 [Dunaliella salina]|eukprot:KAF5843787.1 hypothetical protein DUNSADRAFT_5024 [Dunaliella salina]